MKTKTEIQSNALKATEGLDRYSVDMSMGSGKTLFGLKDMDVSLGRYLVVAPKKSIFQSWKDDAIKFKMEYLLQGITFSTYLSLPKKSLDYDTVYLDEFQNLKFSHDSWLSKFKGRIVGLTGTVPVNKNSEKYLMMNKYCPVAYTYSVDDAVADKVINDYKIVVHYLTLGTNKDLFVKTAKSGFYTSEAESYIYWTNRVENSFGLEKKNNAIARMRALQSFRSKVLYAKWLSGEIKDKHIIFANTTEQADELCKYSYHSKSANSEGHLKIFKRGDIKVLSCVAQLSEGINIPNLKQSIQLHSFSNPWKFSQRLGRGFRLNPEDIHTVHVLCYKNCIDEVWVKQALEKFNQNKIEYVN